MSYKTDQAIAKITDEMMKLDNPIAQGVEEYLTEICVSDEIAEKIMAPGKSLKGATDVLWTEARKRKKGNSAYIPHKEAHALIDEYYGIHEAGHDTKPEAEVVDVMSML